MYDLMDIFRKQHYKPSHATKQGREHRVPLSKTKQAQVGM
jgi:hypothetical protein